MLSLFKKGDQKRIYLATDHAGFDMKEEIKSFLKVEFEDFDIVDCGAYALDSSDDYPDFISKAAKAVSKSKGADFAIILGGSGQGEAICANKFRHVRAAVVNSENKELVKLARKHNNANVLSFGARFVSLEFAKEAVKIFLNTNFDTQSRHKRRIDKILKKCRYV